MEQALGELEGGLAVAFASGLAAEHALITVVCEAGSHVVMPDDLYGGTFRLVDKVLSRWGLSLRHSWPRPTWDAVAAAVHRGGHAADLGGGSPTNPTLNVVDIAAVVGRDEQHALVAVDNTFATPVNQRPLELGVDFVVHSTTKYLGGHSDVVGGVVVTRDRDWYEHLRFVQNAVGAVPGPFDCFLVHRGLRTLHLRMAAHAPQRRRRRGADCARCRGPGRRALAGVQAGWSSFRHPATPPQIAARTRLFTLAESLGGVESLIEVPQAMTHQSVEGSGCRRPRRPGAAQLRHRGPLRIWVGDLRQALGV